MKNEKIKNVEKEVQVDNLRVIDMPKIDITKYIGIKAKIEKAIVIETVFGQAIKLETEILDILGTKEKPIIMKANKLLNLYKEEETGLYNIGRGSKTDEFLKKYECKSFKDMIGKVVTVQATEEKNGVSFLTLI